MSHPTPEDPLCEDTPVEESSQCGAFCWPLHCLCKIDCKMPGHHHPEQKQMSEAPEHHHTGHP
jgi:hypothetical protein